MTNFIIHWIKNDMQIVLKAKLAFTLTLIIAFGLAYSVASWRYSGIVDNCKSSLQAQEERHKAVLLREKQTSSLESILKPKFVMLASKELVLSEAGAYFVSAEHMTAPDNIIEKISGLSMGDKVTLQVATNDGEIIIRESGFIRMQAPIFCLRSIDDKITFSNIGGGICVEESRINIGDGC